MIKYVLSRSLAMAGGLTAIIGALWAIAAGIGWLVEATHPLVALAAVAFIVSAAFYSLTYDA